MAGQTRSVLLSSMYSQNTNVLIKKNICAISLCRETKIRLSTVLSPNCISAHPYLAMIPVSQGSAYVLIFDCHNEEVCQHL